MPPTLKSKAGDVDEHLYHQHLCEVGTPATSFHLVCRQLPLFHHDWPHEYFVHQMQKERYAHADGDEGRDACEYFGLNPSNHLNRSGSDTVS